MTSVRTARLLPRAYRPLFGHTEFRRFLPALVVSDLGDGMSIVAVSWLAIAIAPASHAGLYLGAAVAAYALPGAVGALAFGRLLRRVPARRLLVVHSWLRATLLGLVPVAWALGALSPALYVALLAGSSVLSAWGSAGKYALLAEMLPQEQRLSGNALVSTSSTACIVLGPALAGFLATAISPAWIIGLDALSFAVLALRTGRLRGPARELKAGAPADTSESAAGLRVLRGQPELIALLALTWLFFFLYGPVEVALPLHVTQDLHADSGLLGLFWAFFGFGAILGSLTAGALRRLPLWPVVLTIVAGWGATLLPFGFGAPAAVSLVFFAVGGFVYGPFTALCYTLFQDRTPAASLTTVLAFRGAALLTAAPVGTAVGGPLTALFGAGDVLAGSGAATVLLSVGSAIAWTRVRRRA
ncbi:MFS transporter [Streptomyces sp. NBC_01465]|uniref:MFS transporter n=1 Tax=Streptomyces sp. NBC_01465 TaxID=2903878 RepID=UPI002E33C144|nr:MFS transporter [Streptomyces sp. NBC_01465]